MSCVPVKLVSDQYGAWDHETGSRLMEGSFSSLGVPIKSKPETRTVSERLCFKYYLIPLQFEIENLTSASPQMNWLELRMSLTLV